MAFTIVLPSIRLLQYPQFPENISAGLIRTLSRPYRNLSFSPSLYCQRTVLGLSLPAALPTRSLAAFLGGFEDITTPLESLSSRFRDFLSIFFSFLEKLNKISKITLHWKYATFYYPISPH
jgi:hypothetical protein